MGLDNGFRVKSNIRKIERKDLPEDIVYPFDEDYNDAPEIVYWRKCWGLRDMVLSILEKEKEKYVYEIDTTSQIIDIMRGIIDFMNEETWEEAGRSIWTYQEIREKLGYDLVNLSLMIGYMKQNPDVYLEFYDSY